jgi:hypothetical protein
VQRIFQSACLALFTLPGLLARDAPAFEVASVNPTPDLTEQLRSRKVHLGVKVDGAIADFGAMSLRALIGYAFRIEDFQISGAAGTGTLFDIQAKIPVGATPNEVPATLQQLLLSSVSGWRSIETARSFPFTRWFWIRTVPN